MRLTVLFIGWHGFHFAHDVYVECDVFHLWLGWLLVKLRVPRP